VAGGEPVVRQPVAYPHGGLEFSAGVPLVPDHHLRGSVGHLQGPLGERVDQVLPGQGVQRLCAIRVLRVIYAPGQALEERAQVPGAWSEADECEPQALVVQCGRVAAVVGVGEHGVCALAGDVGRVAGRTRCAAEERATAGAGRWALGEQNRVELRVRLHDGVAVGVTSEVDQEAGVGVEQALVDETVEAGDVATVHVVPRSFGSWD